MVPIELNDLPLFWRGRAKALRVLIEQRKLSTNGETERQAATYDTCADELALALFPSRTESGQAEGGLYECHCEQPSIKCDATGVRCTICGNIAPLPGSSDTNLQKVQIAPSRTEGGRHLTPMEKLENLRKAMQEDDAS